MSQPTMPPVTPGLALNLDNIHGGLYVSTHIVAALWGIACMQSFIYHVNYTKDHIALKVLAAVLWLMLTIQAAFVIKPEYTVLVKEWGNAERLSANIRDSSWQAPISSLTAVVAQSFFTYRLYMFSNKRKLFPIVFIPAILGQLAVEIVDFYYAYHPSLLVQMTTNSTFHTAAILSNAFPVAIDTGISACMTYWLVKESKHSRIVGTRQMIVKLIVLTVNSGFWTALVALLSLIVYLVANIQTYGAVYYTLGALYCNAVLANLNARGYVRGVGTVRSDAMMRSDVGLETWQGGRPVHAANIRLDHTSPESSQVYADNLESIIFGTGGEKPIRVSEG